MTLGGEFVDTNIFLYANDLAAGRKMILARSLVDDLWASGKGCISVQVLQELYVVGTRRMPDAEPDWSNTVTALCRWTIFSPAGLDTVAAINLHKRYQISFWDAMFIHEAQSLGCATLWSEDLNHGQQYMGVRVLNPFHA